MTSVSNERAFSFSSLTWNTAQAQHRLRCASYVLTLLREVASHVDGTTAKVFGTLRSVPARDITVDDITVEVLSPHTTRLIALLRTQ